MNYNYPYKVWLTSIAIAPLILMILLMAFKGHWGITDFVSLYLFFVLIGAIVSLPALLVFCLASKELYHITVAESLNQFLLACIAIGFMCLTFFILIGKDAFSTSAGYGIFVPVSYAVGILISAFMYKLRQ